MMQPDERYPASPLGSDRNGVGTVFLLHSKEAAFGQVFYLTQIVM